MTRKEALDATTKGGPIDVGRQSPLASRFCARGGGNTVGVDALLAAAALVTAALVAADAQALGGGWWVDEQVCPVVVGRPPPPSVGAEGSRRAC